MTRPTMIRRSTWRKLASTLSLLLASSVLLIQPIHANEALTYDANGNVQTRTLPGGTTQFGYDDLDRVNSEAGPAKTQSITYDPNDNRLSDGAGSTTYTANTDRILTENGQSIVLDAAGNITQLRGLTLAWNQAGQLKSVSQGTTTLATYYYDYKGRRSRKVTATATTIYVYDAFDHLIGEFNGTGSPLRTYVWRDDIPVAIIDPGDVVLYLETDHLNTPIAARNQAGTVVWKWESDAFGTTLPNEDPDGDGKKTTINLRFPGQYYDAESGLHNNFHRYYDPKFGRYVSSDPIGLTGGRNTFGYANQNPVRHIDPLGLFVGDPSDYAIVQGVATVTGVAVSTLLGVTGGVVAAVYPSSIASEPDQVSDRSIWPPERTPGYWVCKARADCNDNIPGNCPDNPKSRFAFGGGVAKDQGSARNIAKANATSNLQCQPKHVSCKCTGPKGEQYSGGC